MWCLVVPWGTPAASPWCPPGHAIVPAEVPVGQGSSAGTASAVASREAEPAPLLGGCTPSPEPALLLLMGQERRAAWGHGGDTHPDTAGDTHSEGGSILPPPRSRSPSTPSLWNLQCRDSVSPSRRFSGAPFLLHVPLPVTTRGTGCGSDPRDVTRVQFPWMSPQPAFPGDPSALLQLPIVASGITTRGASLS